MNIFDEGPMLNVNSLAAGFGVGGSSVLKSRLDDKILDKKDAVAVDWKYESTIKVPYALAVKLLEAKFKTSLAIIENLKPTEKELEDVKAKKKRILELERKLEDLKAEEDADYIAKEVEDLDDLLEEQITELLDMHSTWMDIKFELDSLSLNV